MGLIYEIIVFKLLYTSNNLFYHVINDYLDFQLLKTPELDPYFFVDTKN